jgi:hypothetical protein
MLITLIRFIIAMIAFELPISKLEIDYKAYREPGHILTQEEIDYIRNDVSIVAQALSIQNKQGLTKMTAGSNALTKFLVFVRTTKTERVSGWTIFLVLILSIISCVFLFGSL